MKKYLFLILIFFISCVASGPHRYAIYWLESWELENDKRYLKDYFVLDEFVLAYLDQKCEGKTIKIPKFTRMTFLKRGNVRREKDNKNISCVIVEWEIKETTPIKTGTFYYDMSFRLSKGDKFYVLYYGSLSDYNNYFNETFTEHDPVSMFRLTEFDLEKIGKKEISINDREVLLHLALGKPQKIVKETIQNSEYRRYYYSNLGFFYVLNGIVRIKSRTPYRIR